MSLLDDPTFMIYTKGYHPKQLCLGHLVIGDWYHLPVEAFSRSCRFPLLGPSEAAKWTLSTDWKGKVVARKGSKVGLGVEAFEAGHIIPGVEWTNSKVLEAEKGRRVELDNAQKFLEDVVLHSAEVQTTLQRWLSVAKTEHMLRLKKFAHVKPKIWMLTAIYELEGVRTSSTAGVNLSVEVGVSSALIGTLSSVPLGASVELKREAATETGSFREEPQVYAERWQLLQAEYIKLEDAGQPASLALHRKNVYSGGYAMGDGEDGEKEPDTDAAIMSLSRVDATGLEDEDGVSEEYWRQFDEAERKLARRT